MSPPFRHRSVRRLIRLAIDEDLGGGDATTAATLPEERKVAATISTRETIVVAGLPITPVVFETVGVAVEIRIRVGEGVEAPAGAPLVSIRGDAATLLGVERTLLNFLQRMSGVATLTRRYVDAVAGTGSQIADTRKTIPGWRLLDKYAVRTGGGRNHRLSLSDGILIKDNHIAACGGILAAVRQARARGSHLLRIEVECDTLAEVDEALTAGAEVILLDNMSTQEMTEAVQKIAGRAMVEASGGMTLARVREVAETGVDLISVGALTHSAPAVDLTFELD